MVVAADDVAATLRLLIPGFVALSVFYWFGTAVRRADWRWLLWSLLASVPLTWFGAWIASLLASNSGDLASAIAECGSEAATQVGSQAELEVAIGECANRSIVDHNAALGLLIAVLAAVVMGLLATLVWRLLVKFYPSWPSRLQPLAWGVVLRDGQWLMVKLEDRIYVGRNTHVADPVEVDAGDLDLYMTEVSVWTPDELLPLTRVTGMLVRRDDVKWIQFLKPAEPKDSENSED